MSDYFAAQQTSNAITVSNSMNDGYLQTERNKKEEKNRSIDVSHCTPSFLSHKKRYINEEKKWMPISIGLWIRQFDSLFINILGFITFCDLPYLYKWQQWNVEN